MNSTPITDIPLTGTTIGNVQEEEEVFQLSGYEKVYEELPERNFQTRTPEESIANAKQHRQRWMEFLIKHKSLLPPSSL